MPYRNERDARLARLASQRRRAERSEEKLGLRLSRSAVMVLGFAALSCVAVFAGLAHIAPGARPEAPDAPFGEAPHAPYSPALAGLAGGLGAVGATAVLEDDPMAALAPIETMRAASGGTVFHEGLGPMSLGSFPR